SGKPTGYHPNIRGRSRFVPDDRSLSLLPAAQPRLSWVITGGDESREQGRGFGACSNFNVSSSCG
ncbi:hypothetical protein, partial [Cedecea sp.]|uniref:hypothetical protein n=1 Tax=Cedecea sp. TaxID=1970739 RepID=UPI002F41FDC0